MGEFRKDPITGRWVIIAAERAQRPRQVGATKNPSQEEPCPFCAGNEAMTPPEVWASRPRDTQANRPGWRVRVVPNKYPALENGGQWQGSDKSSHFAAGELAPALTKGDVQPPLETPLDGSTLKSAWSTAIDSFYQSQAGLGVHEVIVECPDHTTDMAELADRQFAEILRAYSERLGALRSDPRWRYFLIYKNQGDRAGATFEHLHSQLVALPSVPREALDEIAGAKAHFAASGRCIYCEILDRERVDGKRVIFAHEKFIALCPFASRFAYETWILPKAHGAAFADCSEHELRDCAHALSETIRRLNRALDNPPFNYFIHSLPTGDSSPESYHWHLEILPQLSRAAGFELGSGSNINAVAPEAAAKLLRDVML